MKTSRRGEGGNGGQGMNWISQVSRLAIYIRDGFACVYCSSSVETGARLTLDHCKPRSKGGANDATNLVTACVSCNSARCDRPLATFMRAAAVYRGVPEKMLAADIRTKRARTAPRDVARIMIALRGSCAKVLADRISGQSDR
jgi:hypothetical protein